MRAPPKTNAVRILEKHHVPYELVSYEVDPNNLVATDVARKIGLPPEVVFKTLLARGDETGPMFAVVAANSVLDLKRLARVSSNKRVEMVKLEEVEPLTGYVRGGVTALGAKKDFPVYADERILHLPRISVSAGRRGLQMLLAPEDYRRLTRAVLGDIARLEAPGEMESGPESG